MKAKKKKTLSFDQNKSHVEWLTKKKNFSYLHNYTFSREYTKDRSNNETKRVKWSIPRTSMMVDDDERNCQVADEIPRNLNKEKFFLRKINFKSKT